MMKRREMALPLLAHLENYAPCRSACPLGKLPLIHRKVNRKNNCRKAFAYTGELAASIARAKSQLNTLVVVYFTTRAICEIFEKFLEKAVKAEIDDASSKVVSEAADMLDQLNHEVQRLLSELTYIRSEAKKRTDKGTKDARLGNQFATFFHELDARLRQVVDIEQLDNCDVRQNRSRAKPIVHDAYVRIRNLSGEPDHDAFRDRCGNIIALSAVLDGDKTPIASCRAFLEKVKGILGDTDSALYPDFDEWFQPHE